jgi:hypothetical protein
MWARGEKLPSRIFSSMMTCPCGVAFDSHDPEGSYVHRGHMTLNETLTHREANAKGYASETAHAKPTSSSACATLSRSEITSDIFRRRILPEIECRSGFDFLTFFELRTSLLSRLAIGVPIRFMGWHFRERLWRDWPIVLSAHH